MAFDPENIPFHFPDLSVSLRFRHNRLLLDAFNDFSFTPVNETYFPHTNRHQLATSLVYGEHLKIVGYSMNEGPNVYDCIYLGENVMPNNNFDSNKNIQFTIGGEMFCEDLANFEDIPTGLSGSPILKSDYTQVVGVFSSLMTEDVSVETSTGAEFEVIASNGIIHFVPLIGLEVRFRNNLAMLTLRSLENGIFESKLLNPKTGDFCSDFYPYQWASGSW